jgi:hypothetical protein
MNVSRGHELCSLENILPTMAKIGMILDNEGCRAISSAYKTKGRLFGLGYEGSTEDFS